MLKGTALVCALVVSAAGHAALFSGNSSFTTMPFSTMGPIVNNTLVLNDGPLGFTVSGQVEIMVPSGQVGGTLIYWEVDRPLDPTYGSAPLNTTTILTGFSQPPTGGTYGLTLGETWSEFNQYPGTSKSQIPITLTNGAAVWNSVTVTSSNFPYVSAAGANYVRQQFWIDGSQISGPGGIWLIDVPVETRVTVVPEPVTLAVFGLGLAALARRRRQ